MDTMEATPAPTAMEIDSPPPLPVVVPRQHTCRNTSSTESSSSGTSSCREVSSATSDGASKKCTCPYERPTLKTAEAAAQAENKTTRNNNHVEDVDRLASVSLRNSQQVQDSDVDKNSGVLSSSRVSGSTCDSGSVANGNQSIIKSLDCSSNQITSNSAAVIEKRKSKKGSARSCSCAEEQQPKVLRSSSSGDGILSNCLSALNFVSGNRLGGDSKSPRGSKAGSNNKSVSLTESVKPSGENSRPNVPIPAKVCKCCQGTTSPPEDTSSSSKDKSSSKTKRSSWSLRFNCGRLKGSKSSSSLAIAPSPSAAVAVKESESQGSLESATKSNLGKTERKKKNAQEPIVGSSSTAAEKSSRPVSIDSLLKPSSTSSGRINTNFGVSEGNHSSSSSSSSHNNKSSLEAVLAKDSSRSSFVEVSMAAEDCDEWARIQREKEIEEGVEAPPGYLPKLQGTRTAAGSSDSASVATEEPLTAAGAALASQQLNMMANPLPSLGGLGSSQWPHVFCSSTPDWQQQQQRFLMKQALLASASPGSPDASAAAATQQGPKIHSQIDFIHCLVPDLQKITNCGFYWGKMDRYQAETLLDGKPEGTFLLRDSAQEEFLFSVSFRKYGRSLHARIEQFNHKFSFDSHDTGVYSASTVTSLLEHYKDPSCVMFFEPMLTQPLNRNFCFSLQQLCRATIVSQTTYDSIGDLKLPQMMQNYLKEYHYKQKVRVKLFDELRTS